MSSSLELQFKALAGKRVLVTGASGFIGSSLVRELLNNGAKVIAMVRPSSDLWRIADILDQLDVVRFELGEGDTQDLRARLDGTKIIFHLGAAGVDPSGINPYDVLKANVQGTLSMLELARDLKVERFVHSGSCSEYGMGQMLTETSPLNPVSEYDVSKASSSMLANMFYRKYALPVVVLRLFLVYGPYETRHRLVPQVINHLLDDRQLELTAGAQTRDFVYVKDAVRAFCLAAIAPDVVGETFNICTGQEVSVKDAVLLMVDLMGSNAKPAFGARPYRPSEFWKSSGNPSWSAEKLKWRPQTDLKSGLLETIDWFKKNRFAHYQTVTM